MGEKGIDDAKVAEAAYLIWLGEGQPEGRDFDHWLQAREALQATPPAPRKRAAARPKTGAKSAGAGTRAKKSATGKAAPEAAPRKPRGK